MSRRLRWRSIQFFSRIIRCLSMFFLVMENVTEIHFSKCKCPDGYGGDPYNFSQESWDVCQCSFWSWRMWVKSIFQKVNVPAATMAILMVFLKNIRCHGNFLEKIFIFSKCECPGGIILYFKNESFHNKTAESLQKRYQIWLLWIFKKILKHAKTTHFLNENVFVR